MLVFDVWLNIHSISVYIVPLKRADWILLSLVLACIGARIVHFSGIGQECFFNKTSVII